MLTRILVVFAVILGSIGLIYWAQRNVPSESRRVRNPQAYSVCIPEGWSSTMITGVQTDLPGNATRVDGISFTPDEFKGIPPRLFVNRFQTAPDVAALHADGWTDGSFQNQPAFLREKKFSKGLSRGAVFERSGRWFEVAEVLSVPDAIQKDDWWQFLESFHAPDGEPLAAEPAPITPTTAPASTAPFIFPAAGQ